MNRHPRLWSYEARLAFVRWVAALLGLRRGDLTGDSGCGLLMRCVAHIETAMSEHNDGFRLYGEVCRYLHDLGYHGWLDRVRDPRSLIAAGIDPPEWVGPDGHDYSGEGEVPPDMNSIIRAAYADLKGATKEERVLRARGGMPLTESRAERVASDSPPLFGPIPQCFTPVEDVEPEPGLSLFGPRNAEPEAKPFA